jgi:hypothetical protein
VRGVRVVLNVGVSSSFEKSVVCRKSLLIAKDAPSKQFILSALSSLSSWHEVSPR